MDCKCGWYIPCSGFFFGGWRAGGGFGYGDFWICNSQDLRMGDGERFHACKQGYGYGHKSIWYVRDRGRWRIKEVTWKKVLKVFPSFG